MQHLHEQGFPVPAVFDVVGGDLVMERIAGPTMLEEFARRPWRLQSWARELASLHERLGWVAAPTDIGLLERFGRPEVIVHAALHPDNVMLTSSGPVEIDGSTPVRARSAPMPPAPG